MSDCCGPSQPCCGGGARPADYDYGSDAPYLDGVVDTFAGPIARLSTTITPADRRGTLRMRLGAGRSDYRVRPALYAVGNPDDASPVLVTGNYKLTVDTVRAQLAGRDVWLLVIDSYGINVWCAAGKGRFGTDEVVRMVREARLEQVVSHTRIVLPQLSATGVAGHDVRRQTGFSVVWGPVRATDIGAFLDAGFKATEEMRRVRFTTRDRAALVGVELSVLWRPKTLAGLAGVVAAVALAAWMRPAAAVPLALAGVFAVLAVVAGAGLAPVLLPWLPGRSFSLKGAVAAVLLLVPVAAVAAARGAGAVPVWGAASAAVALASFVAMNFTGSSTYTSPSGVEWEMRRAIPLQVAGAVLGMGALLVGLVVG